MTNEEVRQIRKAAQNGWSFYALGQRFGRGRCAIQKIVERVTYKDVE